MMNDESGRDAGSCLDGQFIARRGAFIILPGSFALLPFERGKLVHQFDIDAAIGCVRVEQLLQGAGACLVEPVVGQGPNQVGQLFEFRRQVVIAGPSPSSTSSMQRYSVP